MQIQTFKKRGSKIQELLRVNTPKHRVHQFPVKIQPRRYLPQLTHKDKKTAAN